MTAAPDRRFELLYLVDVYHAWRTGNRRARRWADDVLRARMPTAGSEWTGSLDIAWFTAELAKVKAEPGEYLPGSYERWRNGGLPLWAARAAGLYPVSLAEAHRHVLARSAASPPADELLDITDEQDRVVGQARRGEAYARRLRHRCVFVLAYNAAGEVFVHRRTAWKLVFPGMYDMFVGGVVGAGESYDEAALREAEEELGVSGLPAPTPLFKFLYETPAHTWWCAIYEVRCEAPVNPQPEEIAWYAFLTEEELQRRLTEWRWVPDGKETFRRLLAWRREQAEHLSL